MAERLEQQNLHLAHAERTSRSMQQQDAAQRLLEIDTYRMEQRELLKQLDKEQQHGMHVSQEASQLHATLQQV